MAGIGNGRGDCRCARGRSSRPLPEVPDYVPRVPVARHPRQSQDDAGLVIGDRADRGSPMALVARHQKDRELGCGGGNGIDERGDGEFHNPLAEVSATVVAARCFHDQRANIARLVCRHAGVIDAAAAAPVPAARNTGAGARSFRWTAAGRWRGRPQDRPHVPVDHVKALPDAGRWRPKSRRHRTRSALRSIASRHQWASSGQ